MLIRYASVVFICASLLTFACGPRKLKGTASNGEVLPELHNFSISSKRITLMTWNMENLFDAVDNPNTNDDAFLPLAVKATIPGFEDNCKKADAISWVNQCLTWDWTDAALEVKLDHLAQVIRTVNNGKGPDILVVQEIENIDVLNRLIQNHLPGMGYTAYLIENNDLRGIDVGLITRLTPTKAPVLKPLRSRPALVTQFDLGEGQKLNLIGVHFPISPASIEKRVAMLDTLAQFAAAHPNEYTIAAGDFNFPDAYEKHYDIINKYIKPDWIISHLYVAGYQGTFYDSYEQSWSKLDLVLLSKNFMQPTTAWTLDTKSIHIHNPLPMQSTYEGYPAGFNLPSMKGVSDHWPVVIQLVKTTP